MYYLIKKYQKKLLAVFAVLLMVAFVATLGVRGPTGTRRDPVVAKAGDTDITDSQMRLAKDEWETANRMAVRGGPEFGNQPVPLPYRALPITLVQQIQQHPELFLLLQIEAKGDGLSVDLDEARSLVAAIRPDMDVTDPRMQDAVQAARAVLLVRAEVSRLGDVVKVSAPAWQHAAQTEQMARINLVEFRIEDFEKNVSVPTPEQLRQQFDKYKNSLPRSPDAEPGKDNPLGVGYQVPSRVKLQYVEIPHAQVVDAVKGDANHRYELQVQAAEYYDGHKEEFRNTPPTTRPTSAPATAQSAGAATQPATAEAAASQPAIKPFAEVKEQIIDKLIETEVQKRTALIEQQVTSRLAEDWIKVRRTDGAATRPSSTQPTPLATTAPSSQQADELRSIARLEQLSSDIQKQFGVLVAVHDIARDWQASADLSKLPGIGSARTTPHTQESFGLGVPFAEYALSFTEKPGSLAVVPLQVFEPSEPLTDAQQNAYVFRLTAAEPAHAPPDMTNVADQVARDWRLAQAYDQAKQAAQKLLDASKAVGLSQAARTGSLTVISAGPFSPQSAAAIPGYPLPDRMSRERLGTAAADLLKQASAQDRHPVDLVELPTARRVVVAELGAATLPTFEWLAQIRATGFEHEERFRKLSDEWFSYDRVVERLHFTPEDSSSKRT